VERDLLVLDTAEKVAQRLQERVRKRIRKEEPEGDEIDRLIALRRGARHDGIPEGQG
jgi:ubiquinone biosynthesis protein COQ9